MDKRFHNKKILISAGPTYEPIDPVRFIGNRSSGKMGYALALKLAEEGAQIILISGPVSLSISHPNITRINVETAEQMYDACCTYFSSDIHIGIFAAAVADYTPKDVSSSKIKKQDGELTITLVKTKDILLEMGKRKQENQILVGFALETDNEIENARNKCSKKNLDFIVLNSLKDEGAGFAHDTNKISIINKYNKISTFELKDKAQVALDIIDYLNDYIHV